MVATFLSQFIALKIGKGATKTSIFILYSVLFGREWYAAVQCHLKVKGEAIGERGAVLHLGAELFILMLLSRSDWITPDPRMSISEQKTGHELGFVYSGLTKFPCYFSFWGGREYLARCAAGPDRWRENPVGGCSYVCVRSWPLGSVWSILIW